jgi:hypothetical protein
MAQEPELVPQVNESRFGQTAASAYFGPNGDWLATIDKETVIIYDLRGGRISRRIPLESSDASIAVHPSADTLAVLDASSLVLYKVDTGKVLWNLHLALPCTAIHFNAEGSRIIGICKAAGNPDYKKSEPTNTIRNWNALTGADLATTPLPPHIEPGAVFSEDGEWIVGTKLNEGARGPNQSIIDMQTGRVVGEVKCVGVLVLSAKAHSAVVVDRNSYENDEMQLVDVLTRKVIQDYKGGGFMFSKGQASADGTRFLLPDLSGASIIDATTGQVSHPMWLGAPGLSGVALARDLDQVAFVQSGVVVLSRISRPGETRMIGDPAALEYSQIVRESATKSGDIAGFFIQPLATRSHASKLSEATASVLDSEDISGRADLSVLQRDAIEKQCAQQVKGIKHRRDRDGAEAACEDEVENADHKRRNELPTKFGNPVTSPPLIVFLNSGRLLAILCASHSWGLWDTATGNRLPYYKSLDTLDEKDDSDGWFAESLHEIEREFGALELTDVQLLHILMPSEGSFPSPDGLQYFTRFPSYTVTAGDTADSRMYSGIRVRDTASNQLLFELPDALWLVKPVIPPSGKVLIVADRGNTVGILDRHTGERLGTLYVLQEGEWLLTSPSGWFDGSPRGWGKVAWRDPNGGLATLPSEAFFNEFYRPGLLAELLEGHTPKPPRTISQVDRRQPKVLLSTDALTASKRTATVHLELSEAAPGAGLRDARLFRNGTLVKSWRGDLARQDGHVQYDTEVSLVSGENRFVAYAFNRDNVKSSDAVVTIQCSAPTRQGTAYVLAIGVNQYSNPEFNLKYARSDANHLAHALVHSESGLEDYGQVVQLNLLDQDATKANILLALSILSGHSSDPAQTALVPQLASLKPVQPEDMVAVYFAGHGLAWGDHFYLIPHDLGYQGSREALGESLDPVLRNGISDMDLEQAFDPIDAAHLLLIIDACNSGKLLDAEDERRGPMNNKGLAQLAYEKGMYVLTAAQAYQAALESSRLGYGYLTYALTEEGLKTSAADTRPIDGQVSVVEWFEYASRRVPELQSAALNQPQGDNRQLTFELTPASNPAGIRRLQTPRIYYRRDQPGGDTIIAKIQ